MSSIRVWLERCRGLLAPSRRDAELSEELEAHLQLHIDDLVRQGRSPSEARREALIRSGGLAAAKDAYRDQYGWPTIEQLAQDVRHAARGLIRAPSFTVAIVLSLAIGIGATSAVYTVVERVILRPLPYADPGQLAMLWRTDAHSGERAGVISFPDYQDWVSQSHTIERAAAFNIWSATLRVGDNSEQIDGAVVGAEYFRVLGVSPILGRTLLPGEDSANAPRVTVIAHSLWVRRFHSDSGIIGKPITLDGRPGTIIGVMPPGFRNPEPMVHNRAEIWQGLGISDRPLNRGSHYLRAVARLRPHVTVSDAQHDLDRIAAGLAREYPAQDSASGVNVLPIAEQVVGSARPVLFATLIAAGCVLLIVCGNVTNLVLVRHAARAGELAVRSAIGAGRSRVVRLLAAESVLLAIVGGVLGLAIGVAGIGALRHWAPAELPRVNEIAVDAPVVAVTAVIIVATALICGILPAFRWWGIDAGMALRSGMQRTTDRGRIRRAAIALEVALSLVLVVTAGLLTRTLMRIATTPLGFNADHVLSAEIDLYDERYAQDTAQARFYRTLISRIEAIPGVRSAAMTSSLPVTGRNDWIVGTFGTDRGGASSSLQGTIHYRMVTPGYRQTMQMHLLRGRDLEEADSAGRPAVALVSRTAAEHYFPGIDAVGHRIFLSPADTSTKADSGSVLIVGVVGDVRYDGPVIEPASEIFVPGAQQPQSFGAIVIRTIPEPGAVLRAVRGVLRQIDPGVALAEARPMARVIAAASERQRFFATLFGLFAVVALTVSGIGVYGLVTYTVAQRQSEIGIRMALGARAADVMRHLMAEIALLAAAGLAVGAAGSLATTRLVASLLYGIAPHDPASLAAGIALITLIALGAGITGASRAARIEPADVLRG